MVVISEEDATGFSLTSVTGGGVTTWNKAGEYQGVGEPRMMDIWWGVVTQTGASQINFNWSPAITGHNAEYEVQEFSTGAGASTVWGLDKFGHAETNPASTAVDYPSLAPAAAGELYYGFADMPSGSPINGSDPGFIYKPTVDGNMVAYNPDVGVGAVSPTSSQPATHLSSSVGALFSASIPPGSPTINGISPTSGTGSGGTAVTITGTNLTGATGVSFGAAHGTNIVVNGGGTSLTVTSPPETGGSVNVGVSVTTPGGTTGTLPFTYVAYWMVGTDGGVFSFANAPFEGSLPQLNIHVNNIVSIVPTHDGKGYWMVGSDGGVFAFGDAGFVGSLPGLKVNVNDIVAVVPTSSGNGYWMVGSDGGVFAFGDAGFVGSLPGKGVKVNNVVGAVPTASGKGYWMVGSDGGVFAFGDATFVGSLPGLGVKVSNVVGVVATPDEGGYWMVGKDGGVFAFGDATFVGSIPGLGIRVSNIVAFAPQ
jgi:hypothetical protein